MPDRTWCLYVKDTQVSNIEKVPCYEELTPGYERGCFHLIQVAMGQLKGQGNQAAGSFCVRPETLRCLEYD